MAPLALKSSPGREGRIVATSGRLQWTLDGDDLVARDYRIRLLGPGQWQTTRRGRVLRVDPRRSMAIASAEHHHREMLRSRRIALSGLSAAIGVVAAVVAVPWISTPTGFLLFAIGVGVFVSSFARFVAALSRNILDPYRIREPWERPDWWSN